MTNLPRELILEILLRLPVKSLLRFKSVCKSWLSLISNPQFAKSHFDLAAAKTNRIFFVTVNEVRSLDFEASFHDVSASVKLNFPFAPPFSNVRIWGSRRGFLLLDIGENFFVFNPSTGVCRRIWNSPAMSFKLFNQAFHGIGYDASKDDYLVVLGSYYIEGRWEFIVTLVEIFSFKMNSWKTIQDADFPYIDTSTTRVGLLLNGALHWIAFRYDTLEDVILAFDLIEEKPRELPVPHDFNSLPSCHVAELGGCLSLCTKEDDTIYIWIMKEYGVKSSWSKSVVLSLVATTYNYVSPICTTKCGEIVGEGDSLHLARFPQHDSLELVKFSYRGELLEHRAYSDIPHHCRCKAAVYTESLLSLPSGSEEGGEDLQQS